MDPATNNEVFLSNMRSTGSQQ